VRQNSTAHQADDANARATARPICMLIAKPSKAFLFAMSAIITVSEKRSLTSGLILKWFNEPAFLPFSIFKISDSP